MHTSGHLHFTLLLQGPQFKHKVIQHRVVSNRQLFVTYAMIFSYFMDLKKNQNCSTGLKTFTCTLICLFQVHI